MNKEYKMALLYFFFWIFIVIACYLLQHACNTNIQNGEDTSYIQE